MNFESEKRVWEVVRERKKYMEIKKGGIIRKGCVCELLKQRGRNVGRRGPVSVIVIRTWEVSRVERWIER